MLNVLMESAKAGKPVYISALREAFGSLDPAKSDRMVCVIDLLEVEGKKAYELAIPRLDSCSDEGKKLVSEYVHAELYNILSSIGARRMAIYADTSRQDLIKFLSGVERTFCVGDDRKSRSGYGRAINVLDRMIAAVHPGSASFGISVEDISRLPSLPVTKRKATDMLSYFQACTENLVGKSLCGVDVGGTDIKAVLVVDGLIVDYKEYDWFPANFRCSRQLIDPICLIVRVLQARLQIHRHSGSGEMKAKYLEVLQDAQDKHATDDSMEAALARLRDMGLPDDAKLSGIGLCFPDVVVRNKVVGGEVYKTRGIRNNPDIDYEADFASLTHLDERLKAWVIPGGPVKIINDGPMASFTAAVEMAFSGDAQNVSKGVFAHTLGTELGTGWITEAGEIPDIPLEVYNFIIDLGSWPERAYESDDLRSVNNFNTGLPGTLQKYCSQSGVFRLALKYFPVERPDLFEELKEKGFVVESDSGNGGTGYYVPIEPVDQRKPFLEHMMKLPDREKDETNYKIWREIGEALGVTVAETKHILAPGTDERFLFGRLVKNQTCFDLMVEGGRRIRSDISFIVAGSDMAYTPLMKQLESNPHFTVAQFAQAIGAVYYANS